MPRFLSVFCKQNCCKNCSHTSYSTAVVLICVVIFSGFSHDWGCQRKTQASLPDHDHLSPDHTTSCSLSPRSACPPPPPTSHPPSLPTWHPPRESAPIESRDPSRAIKSRPSREGALPSGTAVNEPMPVYCHLEWVVHQLAEHPTAKHKATIQKGFFLYSPLENRRFERHLAGVSWGEREIEDL